MATSSAGYDPKIFTPLTFHDAVPAFLAGSDTPRAYLERCVETIAAREPAVRAWVSLRVEGARADADAATERYRSGRPLSSVDGMPIGIKDLIETKDLPTTNGIAGNEQHTRRDSACVQALRKAGAIILGKTVTTELGGATPSVTTNPFDPARTAGGSSAGSGAVIGARMVPAALGSQVGGSLIRPASYCANFALRPTMGGLHRGERLGYSHSILGVHAGSISDMWHVAIEIAKRSGGDPGYPGLFGGDEPSEPIKPRRLIAIETEGWKLTDERTISAFEAVLDQFRALGITILRRQDRYPIEAFEQSIAEAGQIVGGIIAWENRWSYENLVELMPGKLSRWTLAVLDRGRAMTLEDYRALLARKEEASRRLQALAPLADAILTLSSAGPAPLFEKPDNPDPRVPYGTTGSSSFNSATSVLGLPAVTIPLLGVDRMPVGIQVIGQPHQDDTVTGLARWIAEHVSPVTA
jgi:Asp-tRNA(Asn)/Glu-tRNA(Gln) amidotransferase A subunit family amidase